MNLLKSLSDLLLAPKEQLMHFILSAPHRYKVYEIKKRNGKGTRVIAHPSKELKYIQRHITSLLRQHIPIHEASLAYESGKGIKLNAQKHCKNQYLLKLDFENFFPSILPTHLINIAKKNGLDLSQDDIYILTQALFWKARESDHLCLSIGAPSSPFISNAIMYNFDQEITDICNQMGVIYTRYADDISFSTDSPNVLYKIVGIVEKSLELHTYKTVKINKNKTVNASKKHNRHVTGVTITNEGELSLGRKRKRILSSQIHKFTLGILTPMEIKRLQGHLGFANHIEPLFICRMELKYGKDIINSVRVFNL
jgi:RNA-directed DNA polymerase